eukprot:m.22231 g.22231  ORF g.22231 m.22231 type:complete len:141 (+) comp7377_c1_seq2:419-841(+)
MLPTKLKKKGKRTNMQLQSCHQPWKMSEKRKKRMMGHNIMIWNLKNTHVPMKVTKAKRRRRTPKRLEIATNSATSVSYICISFTWLLLPFANSETESESDESEEEDVIPTRKYRIEDFEVDEDLEPANTNRYTLEPDLTN